MGNEITKGAGNMSDRQIANAEPQPNELIGLLKSSLYPGAADTSIRMVLEYCRAAHLDPLQKPVHIVPMWDKNAGQMRDVIMPGIGLYRIQAARTGQFAGMSEPEFGPEIRSSIGDTTVVYPEWAKVTVKRVLSNGVIAEFTAVERWLENYAVKGGKERSIAPNSMWTRRPFAQLAKCAAAQALRIAFPEIGAQPTAEEMEGKPINDDVTVAVIDRTPPECSQEKFDTNAESWRDIVVSGRKSADTLIDFLGSRLTLSDEQKKTIKSWEKQS